MQGALKGFTRELTMRRYLLAGAAAALLVLPALAFGRATTTVTVAPNNSLTFGPKTVTKNVGAGAIHWRWGTTGTTTLPHNVHQDDKLFASGNLTNSKPAGFEVVPSAGSFHYFCTLHGSPSGGMAGTIKIRPSIFNQKARKFGVRWSTGSDDTGNAFDVRYRVDGGKWKKWKKDVTGAKATFGAKGKPVRVRAGHTYDVQARSQKKSNPSKKSRWSPRARVTT
jgi:plastocyanin